jgi:hypothetical protein
LIISWIKAAFSVILFEEGILGMVIGWRSKEEQGGARRSKEEQGGAK